jgi:hypothetical protein
MAQAIVPTKSSKAIRAILAIVFSASWIYYSALCWVFSIKPNPWITGEWLINYSAGFQRRGALGSLTLVLSDFTSLPPTFVAFVMQSSLAAATLILLFAFLVKGDTPLPIFLILLGPMGVFYFLTDPAVVGRKELILYAFALLWLGFLSKSYEKPLGGARENLYIVLFTFLLIFAILTHEGFLFFVPILIWITLTHQGCITGKKLPIPWKRLSPFLLSAAASVPAILLTSSSSVGDGMCQALIDRGLSSSVCIGAIDLASSAATESLFIDAVSSAIAPWLIAYFPVFVVLAAILISHLSSQNRNFGCGLTPPQRVLSFFGLFLLTTPIYVIAVDWGRYLSLFFTLLAMVLLFEHQLSSDSNSTSASLSGQSLFRSNPTVRLLAILGILSYYLFFGVAHFGGSYQSLSKSFYEQMLRIFGVLSTGVI